MCRKLKRVTIHKVRDVCSLAVSIYKVSIGVSAKSFFLSFLFLNKKCKVQSDFLIGLSTLILKLPQSWQRMSDERE